MLCKRVKFCWCGGLHDLLSHLADLQLETHLCGEDVRVAGLEGGSGLGRWEEAMLLEKLHDQSPPLIQSPT